MSRRPKWSYACLTAAKSASVTVSRAVAATLSPRSSAAIAHSLPNPRDVPVMNQTLLLMPGVMPVLALLIPDSANPQAVSSLGIGSVWTVVDDPRAKDDVLQRSSIPIHRDPEQTDGEQHACDRAKQRDHRPDPL